jgi:hypothetical protein
MAVPLLLSIFANDVLPIFVVAGVGFLLARVFATDVRTLSRVSFNALSPCLVFHLLVTSSLGAADFGIRRGGAERVEGWVARLASVPVVRLREPRLPSVDGEIVVGGPEEVRDLGAAHLDLVAVLDADRAERRPGLTARERALSTWTESVAWAVPDGRVIVQASHPSDPAVQALVRGNPARFHARERERRAEAGFPVGAPTFRVVGDDRLEPELAAFDPITSLVSSLGSRTVCLLALRPDRVPGFGAAMRELAARGVVERVEAEPHL